MYKFTWDYVVYNVKLNRLVHLFFLYCCFGLRHMYRCIGSDIGRFIQGFSSGTGVQGFSTDTGVQALA